MSIYFHVGYPKCASTTLQRHVFEPNPGVDYYGIFQSNNTEVGQQIRRKVNNIHDKIAKQSDNDFSLKDVKRLVKDLGIERSQKALLSNERILSVFFSYPNIEVKAERIKKIFGECKIIIFIRNQFDLIQSQYRDWPFNPKDLYNGRPVQIDNWYDICSKNSKINYLDILDFNEIIKFYEGLFGTDNVMVACVERIGDSNNSSLDKLSKFMNVGFENTKEKGRTNIGKSRFENKVRRISRRYRLINPLRKNKFINYAFNRLMIGVRNIFNIPKEDLRLSVEMKNKIRDRFSEGNRALSRRMNLNLGQIGYPVC